MLTVANEYCIFTENAEKYSLEDVLNYYVKICPLLYLKGALLPEIELVDDYFGERFVNEEDWETVFNSFRKLFGIKDEFFTLTAESADMMPERASVSEHLTDIYQDMKDFVLLFQKGLTPAQHSAVYELRNLFITHWGPRIAALLPLLHTLTFGGGPQDDLYY